MSISISPLDENMVNNSDDINYELINSYNQQLELQYIHFTDLGKNLFVNIEEQYKPYLYSDMIKYIHDTYANLMYFDTMNISVSKLLEIAPIIYKLFCIDMYISIIPNYLVSINCLNIKEFDKYCINFLNSDANNFKVGLIKVILQIINNLQKLCTIDKTLNKNHSYKNLITKFGTYLEIINFIDSEKFLINYFRPLVIKNINDIQWRL